MKKQFPPRIVYLTTMSNYINVYANPKLAALLSLFPATEQEIAAGKRALPGVGVPPPKFACQFPPVLSSRTSRKGLPCPEEWDSHVPDGPSDMRGFISVRPVSPRPRVRQQKKWVVLE